MSKRKITLKEAQKKNKLEKFIKQEELEINAGDKKKFDETLSSMIKPNKEKTPRNYKKS